MREEVIVKLSDLITAGFGLVAALAWNGAIQSIFNQVFGTERSGIPAMVIYAIIVTFIAVILSIWIGRTADRVKKKKESG